MRKSASILLVLVCLAVLLPACKGQYGDRRDYLAGDRHDVSTIGRSDPAILTVVIDPGHGGRDVGATGASGRYEKEFTLSLSSKVMELLEQEPHIQAFMTRTDDRFISQRSMYRTEYARKMHADVLVSIHGNTFSDPMVSGTETFYYHGHSRRLAQIVQRHVSAATGFRDRGIGRKDLFVVRDAEMPAVLIEVGYLTNPQDEAEMWSDEFQRRVAAAIVEGLKEYQRDLRMRWW